jgi:ABC-type glutathione transport system ATPase component
VRATPTAGEHGGEHEVLHGVDLTVPRGRRVALVGGSGSGKSTCAAAVIGLLPGTGRVTGGSISFDGTDVARADERGLRGLRGRRIGLVPQDPRSNLNRPARVGRQVAETLVTHRLARGAAARRRAVELLDEAGIGRRAARPAVPARVLRRDAPARARCDRTGLRARAADRRRADLGARRHGAAPHPRPRGAAHRRARRGCC